MTIQHKNIADPEIHEPKGLSSAVAKQVYVATGPGAGSWRRLTETDMSYSDKTKNLFGWNDIADSLYTSGSPRSIPASTRTQITNNALATQTDTSRLGAIWDTSLNQFLINDLNATYILRFNHKIKAAAAAGTPYVVKIEIESVNGPTVINSTDFTIKGGSYENAISNSPIIYMGSFINNQALKMYITADTPITLYNTGFVIQRLYKES